METQSSVLPTVTLFTVSTGFLLGTVLFVGLYTLITVSTVNE